MLDESIRGIVISIHAPVWGATDSDVIRVRLKGISIHAPVWGATNIKRLIQLAFLNFNSRSRVGSDHRGILTFLQR